MLKYKTKLTGKQFTDINSIHQAKPVVFVVVVKQDLKLSDRVYSCECGISIDRDLNASINIKNQGKLLLKY
ncbi:zinc ribbon domain-containing protein [Peptostreptococcaceae bacterium AGR-M142]